MEKILFWSLFVFTEIFAESKVRDPCGLDNAGICVLVEGCPTALEQIRAKRRHSLENCGWDNITEIVCCLDEIIIEPMISKSEEACAKYGKNFPPAVTQIIHGGEIATLGEYRHMAALGFNGSEVPGEYVWGKCAGSLISEFYVVTAAHCMFSTKQSPVMVRLGTVDLFGNADGVEPQDIPIAKNILYPQYQHLKKLNDIALIRLERAAEFSANVQPICLYDKPDDPVDLVVTGWGETEDGNISRFLLEAPVTALDVDTCNETFQNSPLKRIIMSTQLCAISKGPTPTDTCQGDSGGPIQVPKVENRPGTQYFLVGVTSFGRGCGNAFPSVYTRVYCFRKWIEDEVWKNGV